MEALVITRPKSVHSAEHVSMEGTNITRHGVSKGGHFSEEKGSLKSAAIKSQEILEKNTDRVVETLREYIESVRTDLRIQVHQKTGKIMVKVISIEDGKVIREVPSEELLNLSARMEEMIGVLFDKEV